MTRDEYIQKVEEVLNEHTQRAASQLTAALALVPPKTRKVVFEIFVDQDGEGFLTVRVTLHGPDLFVLNRAIAAHAELFGTRMVQSGLDPALPLMEPGGETFSVRDTLADCASVWVASVWRQAGCETFVLPATVVSHDGYGTTMPLHLKS